MVEEYDKIKLNYVDEYVAIRDGFYNAVIFKWVKDKAENNVTLEDVKNNVK